MKNSDSDLTSCEKYYVGSRAEDIQVCIECATCRKTLFAAPENSFNIELINKDITNEKLFPKEIIQKHHMVHLLMPSTDLHKNKSI